MLRMPTFICHNFCERKKNIGYHCSTVFYKIYIASIGAIYDKRITRAIGMNVEYDDTNTHYNTCTRMWQEGGSLLLRCKGPGSSDNEL